MIRGTFRILSNINNVAFVRKYSTDKKPLSTFAPPEMFEWVLDTPLMMAVARYWEESISNKAEIPFSVFPKMSSEKTEWNEDSEYVDQT